MTCIASEAVTLLGAASLNYDLITQVSRRRSRFIDVQYIQYAVLIAYSITGRYLMRLVLLVKECR